MSKSKDIAAWVECNSPDSTVGMMFKDVPWAYPERSMREYTVVGARIWSQVANTIMVTTRLASAESGFYSWLREQLPGISIIGGIKTIEVGPQFVESWARVAFASLKIAEETGDNIVVLENETTLSTFRDGEVAIDVAAVQAALAPLRQSGLTYWFNLPRILSETWAGRYEATKALVSGIANVLPDCVFMVPYDDTYWEDMIDLVGSERIHVRLLPMEGYTTIEQAATIARHFPGASIYPGGKDWIKTGELFVAEWNRTETTPAPAPEPTPSTTMGRSAFTRRGIQSWDFDGGRIHRGGKPFDAELVFLKSQKQGQDQEYLCPCLIAPGTDDVPFVIELDEPSNGIGFPATCPKGQPGYPEAEANNGVRDIRMAGTEVPDFHEKGLHNSYFSEGPEVQRVTVNVRQIDGTLRNNVIMGLPRII